MKQKRARVIRFPKRERKALERAIKACEEIDRRGFDCITDCRMARRILYDLIAYDDREFDRNDCRFPFADWSF